MRINKYLAHNKYASRREADKLISAGKVHINGRRAELGDQVADGDIVTVNNQSETSERVYYAYHKPIGVVSSAAHDYEDAIEDIIDLEGVFPVGRLDKDSSGLIILTNDGRVTTALLDPAHGYEKEYDVRVQEKIQSNFKSTMEGGVDIGNYFTQPAQVEILGDTQFRITLTEGKNRQIRKMCNALRYTVMSLRRVRIVNINLGGLKEGQYRELRGEELDDFLYQLDLLQK